MARIYLAPDDEITGIIEKLKGAEGDHVILIVPKNAALLQSVINVRLLKKKADDLKKTLGLVTSDGVTKHLAGLVGLSVYDTIDDVPKTDKIPAHKPSQVHHDEETVIQASRRSNVGGDVTVKQYDRSIPQEPAHKLLDAELPHVEEPALTNDVDGAIDHVDQESVVTGKQFDYAPEPGHHRPKLRAARRPIRIPKWVLRLTAVMVVLAICATSAAAIVIPQATVTLHVPTETVKKQVTLMVDGAAQTVNTTLAGVKHQESAEASAEVKSTGKKSVGDKAKGTITISNVWSTDAQNITKNTAFVASGSGFVFRSTEDVNVPGETVTKVNGQFIETAGKANVAVIADQPGDQYNIAAAKFAIQGFSGDKAAKITGASAAAMSGGTTKDLVIVAQADIDQAKKQAKDSAEENAKSTLKGALPKEEILIEQSVAATSETKDQDHTVGDEAASVRVAATASAIAYATRIVDMQSAIKSVFSDGLPATKQAAVPDAATISWDYAAKGDGKFSLSKEIEGQIMTVVDQANVQNVAAHKMKNSISDEIKDAVSADAVDVVVTPSWWPITPILKSRIAILVMQ